MFAFQPSARLGAAALFSLVLTACGGGGGGGGGGGSDNPGNTGNPGGNPALIAIDAGNAKQLTFASQAIAAVALSAVSSGPTSVGGSIATVASYGKVDETFDCDSGSMKVKGSANASTRTGEITFVYNNCVNGGSGYGYHERMNGTVHITQRAGDGVGNATAYDYRYEDYQYSDLQAGQSFGYAGSFSVDPESIGSRFNGSLTVTDLRNRRTISAIGYSAYYVRMGNYPYSPTYVATQRSGRVADTALGAVEVGAESANTNRSYITGLNQSRVRIDESPNVDSVHLALDANGDGSYERFAWVPENLLSTVISPNSAPTVTIAAPSGLVGSNQDVVVSLGGTLDWQYDLLSYSIALMQSPGGISNLTQQEDASFSFRTSTPGDYVFLITVDDARGGVTTQNLTIHLARPAPIVLPLSNLQAAVGGAPVNVGIQPANADAGPFTYQLLSGPSGMTLDSQGNLQWQPTSAFFDRGEVQASIRVANSDASVDTTVQIAVHDSTRTMPLARSSLTRPAWDKNVHVLDFANDGVNRILIGGSEGLIYSLKYQGGTYVQDWVYPYPQVEGSSNYRIVPFDADHDGRYEVAIRAGRFLHILNEDHDDIERSADLGTDVASLAVADIDNDGSEEIIAITGFGGTLSQGVVLDAATLAEKWRTPFADLGTDLEVGDVDGDAALEIVFSGGQVYDGISHALQWSYANNGNFFGGLVKIADLDGDGVGEIIGLNGSFWSGGVNVFDAVSQSLRLTIPNSFAGACGVGLAQLDGDAARELIVSTCYSSGTTAYDISGISALVKWNTGDSGVVGFAAGDTDNDGDDDLFLVAVSFFGGPDGMSILDPATQMKTFDFNTYPFANSFSGGRPVVENGTQKVMFSGRTDLNTQTRTLFTAIDPATELSTHSSAPNNSLAAWSAHDFCTSDFDSDGNDDILYTYGDSNYYYHRRYDFAGQTQQSLSAGFPASFSWIPRLIACGDFNGDGYMDIASASSGELAIDDVVNAASIGMFSFSDVGQLASGDLDGDGTPEIVVASYHTVTKYRRSGNTYVVDGTFNALPPPYAFGESPVLALTDVDGDQRPEIVLAVPQYDYPNQRSSSVLLVLNGDLSQRSSAVVDGMITHIAPESIGVGQILVAQSEGGALLTPSRQRAAVVDLGSNAWVWRSPVLGGRVSRNSLHYNAAAPNGGSISIATDTAVYITR